MIGVRYVSDLHPTGYGVAGRAYIRALVAAGVPVRWTPVVNGRRPAEVALDELDDPVLVAAYERRVPYDVVVAHTVPEHFARVGASCGPGRLLGMTVWETTAPPAHWAPLLSGVDGVIVPTAWNREVFAAGGVTGPIHVVPHILEDRPPSASSADPPEGPFAFYTLGEWNDRKDVARTVLAYLTAFTAEDDVVLVVKTSEADRTRWIPRQRIARVAVRGARRLAQWARGEVAPTAAEIRRLQSRFPNPPRIEVITDHLSRAEIHALHGRCDCFVSLSHGEGWGLGQFEAAAAGNPVITARFGGPRAFLDDAAAHWITHDLVPVRSVMSSYTPDQSWARPRLHHAVALMREVAADPAAARARGEQLRDRVLTGFSPAAVTPVLLAALSSA